MNVHRATTAQALVRFLACQHIERDGNAAPFFGGVLGIFGHGNLAGVGQALLEEREALRFYPARNEQAMVHIASGYAKTKNRLGALACTTSIGPGATNLVTGAATATINRLPVLLAPGDIFATRRAGSVLQQLEDERSQDVSVNDALRPVSRYWDRINRPEQLASALMEAMRVLTSPADTGAVTLALPQDVQAEAFDFPAELFEPRTWHVARQPADAAVLARAAELIRSARRPVIIAGGGVIYSDATAALERFVARTGIPVAETQAGKGSLPFDHPQCLGAFGVSGSAAANQVVGEADVVVGIGTRYTDFTTASQTLFARDAGFVNLNVAAFDSHKLAGLAVTGDARCSLEQLDEALQDYTADAEHRAAGEQAASRWRDEVAALVARSEGGAPNQAEVIGIVNASASARDVVVCAAGSLPGDLHRLWQSRDPKGYNMEYGYSCMGYEVAGAIGSRMAAPDREVYALVGDGSWLMLSSDIVTAIQEGIKVIVVLVDNHGFGSIAALSEACGSQAFGTRLRSRGAQGELDGQTLAIDFAANARSLGVTGVVARTAAEVEEALASARAGDQSVLIHVPVDPAARFGGSGAWWDVPVAEVAGIDSTVAARRRYEEDSERQAPYLRPVAVVDRFGAAGAAEPVPGG